MADIVFPATPEDYQLTPWTDALGKNWIYGGATTRWRAFVPALEVFTESPDTPLDTSRPWFDSSDGRWAVWDETSNTWIATR